MGVFELMRMSPPVQEVVEANGTRQELYRAAIAGGMRPLATDGLDKAASGIVPLTELSKLRAVVEETGHTAPRSFDAAVAPRERAA